MSYEIVIEGVTTYVELRHSKANYTHIETLLNENDFIEFETEFGEFWPVVVGAIAAIGWVATTINDNCINQVQIESQDCWQSGGSVDPGWCSVVCTHSE